MEVPVHITMSKLKYNYSKSNAKYVDTHEHEILNTVSGNFMVTPQVKIASQRH